MVLKGIIYVLLIIVSAIFLVVSLVMTAVKFNVNGKTALKWLGGLILSAIVLVFAVFLLVKGVVGKAKDFVGNMEEVAMEQAAQFDSLNRVYTNSNDSVLSSAQVNFLIKLEPDSMKGRVPEQFYSYLGFRDYYRLPIVWPYSLHCMDSLGDGSLYSESKVQQFDVNDNGERSCDLHGIMTFAFNNAYLVGTRVKIENKPKKLFFVYEFRSGKEKLFNSELEMMNYARGKGFTVSTLLSCKEYYNEF